MYACIYELRKNWRGTGGRVDGKSKVLQEVLADLKSASPFARLRCQWIVSSRAWQAANIEACEHINSAHRFIREIKKNLFILICGWILETWGLKSLGVLGSSSVIVPLKSKPLELNSFQILNVGPNGTHKNSDIFKIWTPNLSLVLTITTLRGKSKGRLRLFKNGRTMSATIKE